jgi:hypothetical protein
MPSLREFLAACQYLPDDASVRPEWANGCVPGDHEPAVQLCGFDVVDGEVLLRVKLVYLDDFEDEDTEEDDE